MIQCQNIVYVLNEHEIVQPKLRVIEGLTDRNVYDINDIQSDIFGKFIQVETDGIVLNESASQLQNPHQMLENNQNEDVNQTKVQIEPSPHSLRKIECTHCENYIYIYVNTAKLM